MKWRIGFQSITTLATAALFAGCWGTTMSQSISITGGSGVAATATTVGINLCLDCHATSAQDNAGILSSWAASKHGAGVTATYAAFAAAGDTCDGARCHDPLGDGARLAQTTVGGAVRPVVGCESCHGGGSQHYGVGPMAYPLPNASNCGQCHNATSPSLACLAVTPNANALGGKGNPGIYEAYSAAPHARSLAPAIFDSADPTRVSALCGRCHTDEGARKYASVPVGQLGNAALYPPLSGVQANQCRTCHKAHASGTRLLMDNTAGQSAGYNTCVACHQDRSAFHSPATDLVNGSASRIITDTHVDNGTRAIGADLQGYVMRKAVETGCTECHNPHNQGLTEAREWHASAHGDFAGEAWKHYDFKAGGTRGPCQRCHTLTGYLNYTADQMTYDNNNNVYALTGSQAETLYCRGCHVIDPVTGHTVNRRSVAIALLPKGPGVADNLLVTGKGDSMLCLNCHQGRIAGARLQAIIDNNGTAMDMNASSFSSFNSHYFAAAMALFQDNTGTGTGGYQYVGKDYAKEAGFLHDRVGTPSDPSTSVVAGDNTLGPCVACHMSSPSVAGNDKTGSHSYLPFLYDDAAQSNITAISATKCAGCHKLTISGDTRHSVAQLNAKRALYKARLTELKGILGNAGIYYNAAINPYFFTTDNASSQGSSTQYKRWDERAAILGISTIDLVGAAFNMNYLNREPGAWAHNDVYASRLIFDSIVTLGGTPSLANWPVGSNGRQRP